MGDIISARLVAEALIDREVEYIFTLSGGHITSIYQYLENSSVKIFDTRHEQAAVFMAEAYGRITKKPGVAMVSAGPGFTNALSAVMNAKLANTPLLLIAGCVGMESIGKLDLQDMCQLPVIEPMVKAAYVCRSPERAYEYVDIAYRTAASGRPGPVYLELPVDILNRRVGDETCKKPHTTIDSRSVDLMKSQKIIAMMEQAKKPVIIAGSGAWYSGVSDELVKFAEGTGAPVLTSSLGRGVISDTHPLCFESSRSIRPGAASFANRNADLVILLGTRVGVHHYFGDIFREDARIIHVDIEPEEIGRNRTVDLPVVSDVSEILKVCNSIIEERGIASYLQKKFKHWIESLKKEGERVKAESQPDWTSKNIPIHPMRLMNEINDCMDGDDDFVIVDGGDTRVWMEMTRTVRKPGHYLDSGLFGCLGAGLPYAIAAKALNPDSRACLVVGDGSVGFNFMEFETALRKQIPVVVVVNNDFGWGMIRHSQKLTIGHAIDTGTLIGNVPYHDMVTTMGGLGIVVERPGEIKPALQRAFQSGKTTCINVVTDPNVISPGSVALAHIGTVRAQEN
jgi:acetolactate synthase-1/2/3 large subunit